MAGQSNMSGYGRDPAYDPPELGVHLFDNAGRWVLAAHPLNSVPDPVYPNNDAASGTSPALAFARMMKRELGVPVGLVAAALGGSSLEAWNPAEEDPFLYHSMAAKISEVGSFAGMLWYQGCNETVEAEEAENYLEKFTQTVSLWRKEFGCFPSSPASSTATHGKRKTVTVCGAWCGKRSGRRQKKYRALPLCLP